MDKLDRLVTLFEDINPEDLKSPENKTFNTYLNNYALASVAHHLLIDEAKKIFVKGLKHPEKEAFLTDFINKYDLKFEKIMFHDDKSDRSFDMNISKGCIGNTNIFENNGIYFPKEHLPKNHPTLSQNLVYYFCDDYGNPMKHSNTEKPRSQFPVRGIELSNRPLGWHEGSFKQAELFSTCLWDGATSIYQMLKNGYSDLGTEPLFDKTIALGEAFIDYYQSVIDNL